MPTPTTRRSRRPRPAAPTPFRSLTRTARTGGDDAQMRLGAGEAYVRVSVEAERLGLASSAMTQAVDRAHTPAAALSRAHSAGPAGRMTTGHGGHKSAPAGGPGRSSPDHGDWRVGVSGDVSADRAQ